MKQHDNNLPVDMTRPNPQPVPTGVAKTEPAGLVGTITAGVTAVLALLVAYGFDVSQEQQVAILGVVAVIAPVIAAIVTRSRVYSPSTTQTLANEAAVTGNATIAPPPGNGKR